MHRPSKIFLTLLFNTCALLAMAQTNPAILSWVINTTGLTGYNCSGCSPAVAGNIPANVQSVYYDATYAYVSTTGIPSYNIGPWASNPNTPSNQNKIYRIKLAPTNNAVHTATPLGNIGIWSNGIGVFNAKDGMSYNNQGIWNRNAYYYEGVSFDACLGHPAPNGNYHNHVNPACLYDASNTAVHSPIIGYAYDGYPIYGAYAYTNTNGTGLIKRMVSGYTLSPNTLRTNGPAVGGIYPNGCFCEDYVYTGGAGTDLDQYNGRTCVTPEYPAGTYAYFVTIDAGGLPQYPFVIGPTYKGTYSATNTVAVIPGGAVQYLPPLPVELSLFSGKNQDNVNVLHWITATESACAGFNMEYSTDGETFDFLGYVPSKTAHGYSSVAMDYTFTDKKPAADLVYYRLVQKDLDGAEKHSQIISVKNRSATTIVDVYPNPVTDQLLHLKAGDNTKDMHVSIINAQGRVLVDRSFEAYEYEKELTIFAQYLSGGLYWLVIEVDGNRTVKAVVFEGEE